MKKAYSKPMIVRHLSLATVTATPMPIVSPSISLA